MTFINQAHPMTPVEVADHAFVSHVRRMLRAFDPAALATALRFVDRTRCEDEGAEWAGPSPEWYDEFARDVVAAYVHIVADKVGPTDG
jgi:hypothetical protein